MTTPLAVLDLVPISSGSTATQALRNSIDLAQRAEALGYARYWFAEHHLNPGVAVVLNSGIVFSAYRPTRLQEAAGSAGHREAARPPDHRNRFRSALDAVRGSPLTDAEFDNLWHGVALHDGHKLANLLIRYNAERVAHHHRWERALVDWDGPLQLVWGLDDPVSGRHVLEQATAVLPRAVVTELDGVGHYPQSEAPQAVGAAVRRSAAG